MQSLVLEVVNDQQLASVLFQKKFVNLLHVNNTCLQTIYYKNASKMNEQWNVYSLYNSQNKMIITVKKLKTKS